MSTDVLALTVDNFIRAECDMYFSLFVKRGAFGKFFHYRELPLEGMGVRPNRDTLYSEAVFVPGPGATGPGALEAVPEHQSELRPVLSPRTQRVERSNPSSSRGRRERHLSPYHRLAEPPRTDTPSLDS